MGANARDSLGPSSPGCRWRGFGRRGERRLLHLREQIEELLLLAGRERRAHQVALSCVELWQEGVDDVLRRGCDVDEQFPSITRVGETADQAALLEVVEQ